MIAPRFGLRLTLLVILLFSVFLAKWAAHTREQRQAVAAIRAIGGEVTYEYGNTVISKVLVYVFGIDSLYRPTEVIISEPNSLSDSAEEPPQVARGITDEAIRPLGTLVGVKRLYLLGLDQLTDDGFSTLA
jgi:hypothetical protein